MKYYASFVIFEKAAKLLNCRLLQIIGGALRVNECIFIKILQDKRTIAGMHCILSNLSS